MKSPSPTMLPSHQICVAFDSGKSKLEENDLDDLRNLFANSHINVLLGSAFCHGLLPTLGNRERWLEWCQSRSWAESRDAETAEAILQLEYFKNILFPMNAIKPTDNMVTFVKQIRRLIETRGTITIPKRACIFTTNYDPMVELALEQSGCIYNDGFEGRSDPILATRSYGRTQHQQSLAMEYSTQVPTINVVKLHGSVTWKKHPFDTDIHYGNYTTTLTEINEMSKSLLSLDALTKAEVIIESKPDDDKTDEMVETVESISPTEADELVEFLRLYHSKLHLINPTKRKFEETVMGLTYYELLRMYANELDRNNALLLCFGFSFDDEHILEITRRALDNPQLILLICCHTSSDLAKYQQKFPHADNVWYVVPDDGGEVTLDTLCALLSEVH